MKTITLTDFLTDDQINQCMSIYLVSEQPAKLIAEQVIETNLEEINRKLGCENLPIYLAYAVEHAFNSCNIKRRF